MSGLQKILKTYGEMTVGKVKWVWDYANDKAIKKSEMTKEMEAASEKAKWDKLKSTIK